VKVGSNDVLGIGIASGCRGGMIDRKVDKSLPQPAVDGHSFSSCEFRTLKFKIHPLQKISTTGESAATEKAWQNYRTKSSAHFSGSNPNNHSQALSPK